MANLKNDEKEILRKYLDSNTRLYSSLMQIREAMENIWNPETPVIVKNYTDHGERHCERIIKKVKSIIRVNFGSKFTDKEIYLLLAGIYLHDIGLKCDVINHPKVLEIAKDFGANFSNVHFIAQKLDSFSLEEQKAIRSNHHYITAAWIKYAFTNENTKLAKAIKDMNSKYVDDLIDICKFHSQLSINECPPGLKFYPNERKRLVAAILRFADELDTNEDKVSFDTMKLYSFPPENSVYWWLHHFTAISFIGDNDNIISISLELNPYDAIHYGNIIYSYYIGGFKKKNEEVLDVLAKGGIPLYIDYYSDIKTSEATERLPSDVIEEINNIWLNTQLPTNDIENCYMGTVYGSRSAHFKQEKKILARKVVERINAYLSNSSNLKYCLLIDSGTTAYHIFSQVCREMRDPKKKKIWSQRVFIVTNNLPGLQYLMMNCKENPYSDHSEIALKCFFLPGKPLQPYVSVACEETVKWLSKLKQYLSDEWKVNEGDYKIIAVMSASYVVPNVNKSKINGYYPVARETWHLNIKKEFINLSHEVFFVSPLLQFSFARVELLNKLLDSDSNIKDSSKRDYKEIPVPATNFVFFTTSRNQSSKFYSFSRELLGDLMEIYKENVVTEEFSALQYVDNSKSELMIEIPNDNLREKYEAGLNIWDKKLIKDDVHYN